MLKRSFRFMLYAWMLICTPLFAGEVPFTLFAYTHCDDTTETGEDEVYFVITEGGVSTIVGPFDLNDSGSDKRSLVKKLISTPIPEGVTKTFSITMMESDWNPPKDHIDTAMRTASSKVDPNGKNSELLTVLREAVKLAANNTDDKLGEFTVTVTNRNGTLDMNVTSGPGVLVETPIHTYGIKQHLFRAVNCSANYHTAFWHTKLRGNETERP